MNLEQLKNLDLNDLQNLQLDFNDIGSWPLPVRVIALVILLSGILFAGYWFHVKGLYAEVAKIEAKEQDLKKKFERDARKAANLEAYRAQLDSINESFGAMLRQLPDKTEVAELLVDVSQTGLAAGLEFKLFKPGKEVAKDFYMELPISLQVVGTYHQFAGFVSGLAALPRIVTLHNIAIAPVGKKGDLLTMTATAKTYRYLDKSQRRAKRKGRRRRR